MLKQLTKLGIIALLPLTFAACGGASHSHSSEYHYYDENEDHHTGPYYAKDTADLAGLYDISVDTEEGFDEYYLYLDIHGNGTIYDYAGDSYDNYANCYWIIPNSLEVFHLFDTFFDTGTNTPIFEAELVTSGFKAIIEETNGTAIEHYDFAEGINIHDMEISECSVYFLKQSSKPSDKQQKLKSAPPKERKLFGTIPKKAK